MIDLSAEAISAANAKSRRLRELLHDPKLLVMPGAWDVLSARLFESLGFPAIQGTSGGIAAASCTEVDVNGDSRMDFACIGTATANLKWYENLGMSPR